MARQPIVPVLGDQGQNNFTTRSQGYRDTALGTLFSGVADTANAFIGAADRAVRRNIQEEIRAGVSEIFENVSISTEPESGTASATQGPATALPNDARVDLHRIKKIRQKWEAGKISTTHMHTASAALMKNLKSRYSGEGYRQLIDSTMASYGFNPSNQVLRENIAAQSAARQRSESNAAENSKRNTYMIEYAMKNGHLVGMPPEVQSAIIANPVGAASDPRVMSVVRGTIAQNEARKYVHEEQMRGFALEAKVSGKVSEEAGRVATSSVIDGYTALTGANGRLAALNERVNKAQFTLASDKADGIIDPKNMNEALATYDQYRLEVERFKAEWMANPVNRQVYNAMKQEDKDKLFKFVDDRLEQIGTAIRGNSKGAFAQQAALLNLSKDSSASAIFNKYPDLLDASNVASALGPTGWGAVLNKQPGILDENATVASNIIANGVLRRKEGFTSLNEAVEARTREMGFLTEGNRGAAAKRVIDINLTNIRTGQDAEARKNSFYATFGRGNAGFMSNVRAEDRRAMYLDLTSPATRKGIQEMIDRGVLPADAWQSYTAWTTDAFRVVSRDAIASAQEHNRNAFDNRIVIDEKTGFFKVEETPAQRPSLMGQNALAQRARREYGMIRATAEQGQAIAAELNAAIAPLKEGYEKTNTDTTSALRRLVPGNFFPAVTPTAGPGGTTGPRGPLDTEGLSRELDSLFTEEMREDRGFTASKAIAQTTQGTRPLDIARAGMNNLNPEVAKGFYEMAINEPENLTEEQIDRLAIGYATAIGSTRVRLLRDAVIARDMGDTQAMDKALDKLKDAPTDEDDMNTLKMGFKKWWKDKYMEEFTR